jgi:hypothetical protein
MTPRTVVAAFAVLGLASAGCTPSAKGPAVATTRRLPSADMIQDAMRARYASAHLYEDHGTVLETLTPAGSAEPHDAHGVFRTAFDRSTGSFRFDFAHMKSPKIPRDVAIVWRRGSGDAQRWSSALPTVSQGALDEMLRSMALDSFTTSVIIHHQLFGCDGCTTARDPFQVDGEEPVNHVLCFRLTWNHDGDRTTLWIGEDDHLLYRVHEQNIAARGVSNVTIEYRPVLDKPIDPARFDFTPPAPASAPSMGSAAPGDTAI